MYGVVVAFMIILSWQNYTNLNQTLIDESASLLAMWRDSKFFDDKDQKKIETAIINYAKSVTDYEWINFKQKNKASIHNPEYLKL